ncbi:flagellar hook assembly protein FlgD [Nocardioides fonticola]|uniref:Flagellar hook assembly protein FlgD n=1 Tax=Nocardioides fonticola TaxID=450363 RepID=A0ABP7XD61_9ACTN
MSISATEGVGSTAAANGGLSSLVSSTATSSKDKDMFLQLLVAQLKYQDPSNPADTTQFMAQSAQFTALEKMQDVADQTRAVLAAQMAFGGTSMVGRTVDYQLSDGTKGSGLVDSVTFDATGPVLDIGGTAVPLVNVVTVKATGSTGGTGGTTAS